MEVGDVFPVEGFGHRELARDGVDDKDPGRRLVSTGSSHTVTQETVLITVRPDLAGGRETEGGRVRDIPSLDTVHLQPHFYSKHI